MLQLAGGVVVDEPERGGLGEGHCFDDLPGLVGAVGHFEDDVYRDLAVAVEAFDEIDFEREFVERHVGDARVFAAA